MNMYNSWEMIYNCGCKSRECLLKGTCMQARELLTLLVHALTVIANVYIRDAGSMIRREHESKMEAEGSIHFQWLRKW